jgi:ribosomal peptide maturation radical SAM protein 1
LGVSSLLSVLRDRGIEGDVHYLNLSYGERVGWDFYDYLTNQLPTSFLPGEMVFTRALWHERAADFAEYDERIQRKLEQMSARGGAAWKQPLTPWEIHGPKMRTAIDDAPRVISEWADAVLAGSPRVLGFTSTFQQSIAALALAREVRRRVPAEEVAIVFGGANCEDDMGRAMSDNFDFIDHVVSGEAEGVIVDLVQRLLDGDAEGGSPPRFVQGTMVRDMDALPIPGFDDYFSAVQQTSFGERTWLAAESSRGCWWGAKAHCTFCGLNGGTMAFRSKSAPRFAAELETLSRKYGSTSFALTDNILDMSYLRTLLPEMVAKARNYQLFYETKSNLRKDQVELLAAAGVAALQPGIESFSTSILKLMAKGTTRLQNVQLLKWCFELGVVATWNLLYGFPGEDPNEYLAMADLLPALFHLPPPMGCSKMRLDRFGPYWKAPESYGLCNLRHQWSYDFAYAGLPEAERDRLAYFFEHDYVDGSDPLVHARPTAERVAEWREVARDKVRLELRRTADGPIVFDTRPCRWEETYSLTAPGLALLSALDAFRSREGLLEAIREQGVEISDAECEHLLADFFARRLVIEENGNWLSLVVDPEQRKRVTERRVAIRLNQYGFRWPDDFPDPAKRAVVRAAMLALGTEQVST